MKVSLAWISDYVAHGRTAEAVADLLTMSGLEVEGIETTGPNLDGVVVGHVLKTRPHPGADRLTLCTVDLGEGEPVPIVCGAPNVAPGQKVPVATVGTVLQLPSRESPGTRDPVTIKRSKIRGEASEGMICAEDEIGLGESHAGILVLDPDALPGTPLARYLAGRGALPGDAILALNVTPNRPDATSHLGVARDLAALVGERLVRPEVDVPEAGGEAGALVSVEIRDPEACPRYVGLVVRGVRVGPSPPWLRERLAAIGLRSVSNVVDVTNFVLHESGQPLHAFDLAKLQGPDGGARIVVRRALAGERLTTLDGQDRAIPEGALLICDETEAGGPSRPIAVAGVMGGSETEVTDETTDVLIESAYFNPSDVRRAARRMGLSTDAAYRFERGVDPTAQAWAAARAAALLAEIAGGTAASGLVDAHPLPYAPRTVSLRPERIARLLGAPVPEDEAVRLLTAIGFGVDAAEETTLDAFVEGALAGGTLEAGTAEAERAGLRLTIPPWRPDVTREVDVIEEVARLWGFDQLPEPSATPVPLVPADDAPSARLLSQTREALAALGFHEAYTNSLVPEATALRFADAAWTGTGAAPVPTLNPISQEMAALRPSLLPGLLGAAAYNRARGAEAIRLFEAGRVFARGAGAGDTVEGYHEHTALALVLAGPAERGGPHGAGRALDFYDLKGLVASVLDRLGVSPLDETPRPEPSDLTAYALDLHAGGRRVGTLARLSDALAGGYDLAGDVFAAELDWDALAPLAARGLVARYAPVSRFPAAERDLAVVVDAGQPAGPLSATIREAGGPLLQAVRLFDVYAGDRLPQGKKSLAFALRFGADRTLRDKEIEGRMNAIVRALDKTHGASLRQ